MKRILSIVLDFPFKINSQILDPDKWLFCIVSIIESVDELEVAFERMFAKFSRF